ncbi:hypothetical protein ACQY0O_004304 [Thecaphora frezii]
MTDYAHQQGYFPEPSGGGGNFAGFGIQRLQRRAEDEERERQQALQWEQAERERLEQEHHHWHGHQQQWPEQHQWQGQQHWHGQQQWPEQQQYPQQHQQHHAQSHSAPSSSYYDYHDAHAQLSRQGSTEMAAHEPYGYDRHFSAEAGHSVAGPSPHDYGYIDPGAIYSSPDKPSVPLPDAQRQAMQPSRSDTLDTCSSGSAIGLAYDRASVAYNGVRRPSNAGSSGSTASDRHDSSGETVAPVRRRSRIPQAISYNRETCYDDDFEEGEDDDADLEPAGWASVERFSHFVSSDAVSWHPSAKASADEPLRPPELAPDPSHNRSTIFVQELPKAKCADCGEHFSFEELSDHSCVPRGQSQMSILTIKVPSPGQDLGLHSPSLSSDPPTAGLTPRSPFFDKYSHLVGDAGRLSPAFAASTPGSTRSEFISRFESSSSTATSPVEETQPPALQIPELSKDGPSESSRTEATASSMQRSASDGDREAMERRQRIEQQRAAKKQASAAAAAATVVAALRLQKGAQDHRERNPKADPRQMAVVKPHIREPSHLKQPSSSSVSSQVSLRLDPLFTGDGRQREHSNGAASSTVLTPSSSYDRFTETTSSPATTSYSPTTPTVRTISKSANKGEIDLAGIEDLMRGLTTSPQTISLDIGPEGEAPDPAQTESGRSNARSGKTSKDRTAAIKEAAEKHKLERERQRELDRQRELEREARRRKDHELDREIERLREKEKLRELQRLRKREKEALRRETKKCCICSCSLSSSRTPFVERDGKLLCAKDWKELYLPKCRKCGLSVEKGAVKSSDGALKGVFHRYCFSCYSCNRPFDDGTFYVHNNQPYCADHYHKINGSLCKVCGQGVEGDCRQTETGDRFHADCFRCEYNSKGLVCRQKLNEYYHVDGRRLCEVHAGKVSHRLQRQGKKGLDLKADRRVTRLWTA